ncbi:hypothetical protein HY621_01860 [Candidatus Uhrbacteria bacterium]|nr:hypothetical protein [Candidatus Uhrbacteria bacterium]
MKVIILGSHVKEQARKRGTTEEDIHNVIREQSWHGVRGGRYEACGDFSFEREWNKKYYSTKQVNPVFVEENESIIVITVYVFYI